MTSALVRLAHQGRLCPAALTPSAFSASLPRPWPAGRRRLPCRRLGAMQTVANLVETGKVDSKWQSDLDWHACMLSTALVVAHTLVLSDRFSGTHYIALCHCLCHMLSLAVIRCTRKTLVSPTCGSQTLWSPTVTYRSRCSRLFSRSHLP